jgi:hypothetical protein
MSLFLLSHLKDAFGATWNDALELLEGGWRR